MLQIQFVSFLVTIVFLNGFHEAQPRLELALRLSHRLLSSTVDAASFRSLDWLLLLLSFST